MDWDRDFRDDALYFGTVAGDQANPSGNLIRAKLRLTGSILEMETSVMFDAQKPIVTRPTTAIGYGNKFWVFAGSGRYFTRADGNQPSRGNVYIGLIEEKDDSQNAVSSHVKTQTFTRSDLFNATSVGVKPGGALTGAQNVKGEAIADIDTLRTTISQTQKGWYRNFGTNERQHTMTGYLASTLFVSTTFPGASNSCADEDTHNMYVLDMRSGVNSPYSTHIATQDDIVKGNAVNLGQVIPFRGGKGPAPHMKDPASKIINLGDASIGTIPLLDIDIPSQRHSWREVTVPW
jgi:type IV pilus assembly protein PilY1